MIGGGGGVERSGGGRVHTGIPVVVDIKEGSNTTHNDGTGLLRERERSVCVLQHSNK